MWRYPSRQDYYQEILVDGKATGIDQLDWILAEVRKPNLYDDTAVTGELLRRTMALNSVLRKKQRSMAVRCCQNLRKRGSDRCLTIVPDCCIIRRCRKIRVNPGNGDIEGVTENISEIQFCKIKSAGVSFHSYAIPLPWRYPGSIEYILQ